MQQALTFLPVQPQNPQHRSLFGSLMRDYVDEMNLHSPRPLLKQFQQRWIDSILSQQGSSGSHLELAVADGQPIGFFYGTMGWTQHRENPKPRFGTVLEFYVKPEMRRRGYGRAMFLRLQQQLSADGAVGLDLTADPVTGSSFWEAMGFQSTGELSAATRYYVYEKLISP